MGQYYRILNLDKKEFIHPHKLGDGLKLMEFGSNSNGTMLALALLLAEGNGRGGGDHPSNSPLIGSWARDRIVVAGDYADPEPEQEENLSSLSSETFRDISDDIRPVMEEDEYVREEMRESWSRS